MPGGLFQGLGKLLESGATFLQHQQFAERLRGMQLDEAKAQLTNYVRGMSDTGFAGLKVALALVLKASKDPGTVLMLQKLVESLDSVRAGRTPAVTSQAAQAFAAPPARSFDEDLTLVAGWYDLDQDGRISALSDHIVGLSAEGFQTFRAHVAKMVSNVADQIREHEANEDNAWGSYAEDRMSYMMARLKTGQRDPAFMARLRELQGYAAFYEWVARGCELVWEEQQRQQREAQAAAPPAPAKEARAEVPKSAPAAPAQAETPPAAGNEWMAIVPMLRVQLQEGLASGRIRADRRVSYERLLDKMEGLLAPLNDANTPVAEKAKLIERFRGLMAEFMGAYTNPGAADRLDGLSATARARTLETCIGEMKGFLYRELAQSPPRHTAERVGELMGDLTRAHTEVAQLAEDEAAIAFEHELLRGTAKGLHDFVHREHLMLARPLWQCSEVMTSPHGLFYAGAADLHETLQTLAARLRLDIPSARGQVYGQARWDALRSCHVGVFDLRGHRPGLARTDAPAAVALASTAYELGLACTLGKPVVIVTQAEDALPFDVDIAPCEITDDAGARERALADALDHAWYGRQRTTGSSCLAETFAYLDQITKDHPRRKTLEASGLLEANEIDDPIGFAGNTRQILREKGLGDLQALFPSWPGRYPDDAAPAVFHVMPFSEDWSDEIRDTARAACEARGYTYRRGDEADEGRIVQSIWDDICAAHVVLVDLTGLNLNVLIELGMAHALGRTVLMVRQAAGKTALPRDIEKLRVLDYDGAAGLSRVLENRLPAKGGRTR